MSRAAKINNAETPMSTAQSIAGENADVPDMAALNRSTRYVSGEQYASARPRPCICASGTNIPEMKMSGNLRFSRLSGTGLVEIRQNGTLFDPAVIPSSASTDGGELPGPDGEEVPS
jgi:hypothetical protein